MVYTAKIVITMFKDTRKERIKNVVLHSVNSSEYDDAKRLATEFLLANKEFMVAVRGKFEPQVIITSMETLWMGELLQDGEMRI